jgi:hypothetical protein
MTTRLFTEALVASTANTLRAVLVMIQVGPVLQVFASSGKLEHTANDTSGWRVKIAATAMTFPCTSSSNTGTQLAAGWSTKANGSWLVACYDLECMCSSDTARPLPNSLSCRSHRTFYGQKVDLITPTFPTDKRTTPLKLCRQSCFVETGGKEGIPRTHKGRLRMVGGNMS